MGKVNYNTYTPETDSTPGILRRSDIKLPSKAIILARKGADGCPCGCFDRPAGKKRSFLMGHDARFKGKLIRAHVSGSDVVHVVLEEQGSLKSGAVSKVETQSALDWATRHGWEHMLQGAAERAAAPTVRKPRASKKAKGPQVGDEVKGVKVGRWTKDGVVIAVGDAGVTIEYKVKGGTKQHLISA